jgi:hypothetical protein
MNGLLRVNSVINARILAHPAPQCRIGLAVLAMAAVLFHMLRACEIKLRDKGAWAQDN